MFRLAPSLMAASALHVAVLAGTGLWLGGHGPVSKDQHDAHVASGGARSEGWQWRLIAPRTADKTTDLPRQAPAVEALASSQAKTSPDQPGQTDMRLSAQPTAASAQTAAKAQAPTLDEYLPRGLLSKPPHALSMIDIPFPPGVPAPGRYKAVLALYIDENGVVRRIKTEGEALPAAYQEAARVSFQTASFQPGELHGQAVKSLIHVEVVFDDAPPARGLSSSGLGQAMAQR